MQIFFSIFWWIYFFIFFSGYPLVCLVFYLMAGKKSMYNAVTEKIYPLLPVAYAFVATCFWLLMIYTGRMHFVAERIASAAPSVLVIAYSLSALLFWLPSFRKKTRLSFLHSLPLFLLPFFNMLFKTYSHKIIPHDYIFNLSRIYAAGFIIYLIAIALLLAVKWLLSKTFLLKQHKA